jgi:Na+-transporting NADH:ubiquinone oxidoreductase subunit F
MSDFLLASLFLVLLILGLTSLVIAARAIFIPSRSVTLTVNEQDQIQVKTGQKLLSALNGNGLLIPSACAGAGTCGLCRVTIQKGAPNILPIEAGHFTRSELLKGDRLACQTVIRNDMELQVPENMVGVESFNCTVKSTRFLTPLIKEVILQLPERLRPSISAGDFIQISAPSYAMNYGDLDVPKSYTETWQSLEALSVKSAEAVTRAYSISNRQKDTKAGQVVLNIRLALPPPSMPEAQPGIVSSWLFSLRTGDIVSASGPFGSFKVQDTDNEMIFVGGGVGMAPLRAMIFEQLEQVKTNRKMSFWYGGRSKGELFYADELDELGTAHGNFEWTAALSDPKPSDNWTDTQGFVHKVVLERYLKDHPSPEDCEFYLCGPPLMIRAVLTMLDDLGVDRDHIFNDDFGV